MELWQAGTALSLCGAVLAGLLPSGALALLVPMSIGYACFRRYLSGREDPELALEVYDLEPVLYAPVLWLAV